MTRDRKGIRQDLPDPETGGNLPAPNRFTWPFKRFFWALEKYLLWPIADSFKWAKERLSYRSPLAYIGATLAFAITAGAVAAAIYFHNESKSTTHPVGTQAPDDPRTAATPTAPRPDPAPQGSASGHEPPADGHRGGRHPQGCGAIVRDFRRLVRQVG